MEPSEDEQIRSFDVALATHADLRKHRTETVLTRVVTMGRDDTECALIACQLAQTVWRDYIVTACYMRV